MRKLRGIQTKDFAVLLKSSVPTVQRIENDDPKVERETVIRAAEILGLDFDWENDRVVAPEKLPPEAYVKGMAKRKRAAPK